MREKTISGTLIKKVPHLKPVLQMWVKTVNDCVTSWKGDLPWWYGERACLSLFAGAVWRANGLALEEWSTPKRGVSGEVKRYSGRSDLYFEFRLGNKINRFIAEAKKTSFRLAPQRRDFSDHIRQHLTSACKDVGRCDTGDDKTHAFGVVFTALTVGQRHAHTVNELISDWIVGLRQFERIACAWVFPESARNMPHRQPGGAVFVMPLHCRG